MLNMEITSELHFWKEIFAASATKGKPVRTWHCVETWLMGTWAWVMEGSRLEESKGEVRLWLRQLGGCGSY